MVGAFLRSGVTLYSPPPLIRNTFSWNELKLASTMASAGRNQSSGDSFLFINKNADNLNSKVHAGAINAHVHADARAKKLATNSDASSESLKTSKPSRRVGRRPRQLTKVRQSRILLNSH
jgi:hypothetical protein